MSEIRINTKVRRIADLLVLGREYCALFLHASQSSAPSSQTSVLSSPVQFPSPQPRCPADPRVSSYSLGTTSTRGISSTDPIDRRPRYNISVTTRFGPDLLPNAVPRQSRLGRIRCQADELSTSCNRDRGCSPRNQCQVNP